MDTCATERDGEVDQPEAAAAPPTLRAILLVRIFGRDEPSEPASNGHQTRSVSRRNAQAASAPITRVQIATMIQPLASQPGAPTRVRPAATNQYVGVASETLCSTPLVPPTGPQAPPRNARIETPPPMTGPIESGVNRWPTRIPSAAKGIRPTITSPVI